MDSRKDQHETKDVQLEALEVEDAYSLKNQKETAAGRGAIIEQSLSTRDAFRFYWKAVAWSVIISMATIMESYDTLLTTAFFAMPKFAEKYGHQLEDGSFSLSAPWQIGLSLSLLAGLIIGCFANGYLSDRFGPRRVMLVSFFMLCGTIFILFFAPSAPILLVGNFLCGLPWGIFAAATPAYAAEVAPMALRGYLTIYVNLCWVMGHLIALGVLTPLSDNTTEWAYRIPFAVQWFWPPFLIIALIFAPESPWWLVKKGSFDAAEKQLHCLLTEEAVQSNAVSPKEVVAMMQHTIETERSMNVGSSYDQLFKGTNLRRTEIAVISWGGQLLPGFAIQNYTTYFFKLAGLATEDSFKLSLGTYSIAFVGTCLSWLAITHFGRRTIYITGLACMVPFMFIIGFIDLAPASDPIRWTQSGLLLVWFFIYGVSIGPVPYAIAAEVGASNLRIKTISFGRNSYYFISAINTVCAPYMLNPSEGDLKGKAAFPAGVATFCMLVWAIFRLPETKGILPETLDLLFEDRVPARIFASEAKKYQ